MDPSISSFLGNYFKHKPFEILNLAGDASLRRYYRIISEEETYVLMAWDPFTDPEKYPFLNIRDHFARHHVRVPQIIAVDGSHGLILLEDLGDLTLERKFWESQNQELVQPFYEQALDTLILIHFHVSRDKSPMHVCQNIMFDTDKFLWELNYGKDHVLKNLSQFVFSPAVEKELDKTFRHIAETLDQEPKFVSHRDYHSRNLMIKLGKIHVIDFQDARLGPLQYDLVSLLYDSYVSLNESLRLSLTDFYWSRIQDHVKLSRDHFDEVLQVQTIQRCFKACGSFASFLVLREDRRYLKYIQPTLSLVQKKLKQFPRYQVLNHVISDSGVMEMDLCPTP